MKPKIFREIFTAVLVIIAAAFCVRADSSVAQESVAAANSGFALALLKELSTEQPKQNIFISPFSAASVLQMVDNGAAGETRKEIEQVLGTSGSSREQVNQSYKAFAESLKNEMNVTLTIASSLWYRQGFELKPEFVSGNQQFYGAALEALDFSSPTAVTRINDWAADATHGRIRQIVEPPISDDARVILANAIYFKGKWQNPFDKKLTQQRSFHLADGSEKQVPMMQQHRKISYQRGEDYQAVRLLYEGGDLEMFIFLPNADSDVGKLMAMLDSTAWNRIAGGFRQREGTLELPRFTLEYGTKLNDPLQALGIKRAFSRNADFSEMAEQPLFLSEVKQKAFVAVNEEGTEAAAVTTGQMRATAVMMPEEPFQMTVDRPFVFLICDNSSGTDSILFAGTVFEPKESAGD